MASRVLFVALMIAEASASAQPSELAWQAPASCPDAASVRARIEQRLGRSLDDYQVGISVDVAPAGGRYIAHVDLRATTLANDVRTLTSTRCDDLANAVAVIVARVANEIARHPPRVALRDEATSLAIEAPAALAAPRSWSIGVRLSAISGVGILPDVGLGGELAGYVRRHAALAEVATTRWRHSTQHLTGGGPAHVDVGLDVVALRGGWRPEDLPIRAWAAAEVGRMDGSGVGLANAQVGSGRWFAGGAGFGVAWPMAPWVRLVGMTEVVLAFERVRFRLDDGAVVYYPAPMSARASVGLEVGWQ